MWAPRQAKRHDGAVRARLRPHAGQRPAPCPAVVHAGCADGSEIDGVLHEYTTIEGVQEDVVDILLNLKGIAVKLHNARAGQLLSCRRRKAKGP
jgi:hypothetical protein